MYPLPRYAKNRKLVRDDRVNARGIRARQTIDLSQPGRSFPAIQIEHRLASLTHGVDMCRPVVTGMDHDPKPGSPQDSRHRAMYKPKRLGFKDPASRMQSE
jgi:hypothetical protein